MGLYRGVSSRLQPATASATKTSHRCWILGAWISR
jgi:hypothetical protein